MAFPAPYRTGFALLDSPLGRHRAPRIGAFRWAMYTVGMIGFTCGVLSGSGYGTYYTGGGISGIVIGNPDTCHDIGVEWTTTSFSPYVGQCD